MTTKNAVINLSINNQEHKQLTDIAKYYKMTQKDVLRAMIKREAIRILK